MIVWVNGAFGSGKSTLTEELHRRWPDAIVFDPEYLGYALRSYISVPTGDFQDLPLWRHLVAETALGLREHGDLVLVPMTLVNPTYFRQIMDAIGRKGERLVHVFLDVERSVLEARINAQLIHPDDPAADRAARAFRLSNMDRCLAASSSMPADTLHVRSDLLSTPQLADRVCAFVADEMTKGPR